MNLQWNIILARWYYLTIVQNGRLILLVQSKTTKKTMKSQLAVITLHDKKLDSQDVQWW